MTYHTVTTLPLYFYRSSVGSQKFSLLFYFGRRRRFFLYFSSFAHCCCLYLLCFMLGKPPRQRKFYLFPRIYIRFDLKLNNLYYLLACLKHLNEHFTFSFYFSSHARRAATVHVLVAVALPGSNVFDFIYICLRVRMPL